MKKMMTCLCVLLAWTAGAQNFEGTITWSMKMNMNTDPATAAKLADAQQLQQQKVNDPATQAKIAEMQAKLNDPQMKAAMEANPQMKEQMESALKMMQGGGAPAMSPTGSRGMVIKIKGSNVLTKTEAGAMSLETLFLKDKNQTYRIDRQNKTYSVIDANRGAGAQGGGGSQPTPKVTKTSETAKILNYLCTKYTVELTMGSRTITQNLWTTTEIHDIDSKTLAHQRMGRGQSLMYEGMEGIPLRIESTMAEGGMTMEVTEIKRESLNPNDFVIPTDFTETQGYSGRRGAN